MNLIGEHTDYNGGQVLPIAIERRTWVAVSCAPGQTTCRAVSDNASGVGEWPATNPARAGAWWDYLQGVASELARLGHDVPALCIAITSDVPAGAGLSSSAALEVACGAAIARALGVQLTAFDIARLSHRAETKFVGVSCGIMDQFASALGVAGHAIRIWCDSERMELVPFDSNVLIFDTGVPRSLRGTAFNDRRAECEQALALLRRWNPDLTNLASATIDQIESAKLPEPLERRAIHVVEENRRVTLAAEALAATSAIPAELLYQSHESLRSLYECSTEELDWFVDRMARTPGIRGARLTGAGWGGCAIALGEVEALQEVTKGIAVDYERRFGIEPRICITGAADGVRIEYV